jgi:WXG100 family type VII secretion target
MVTNEPAAPGGSSDLGYDPASMAKGLVAIDGATTEVRTLLSTIQGEVDGLRATWKAHSNIAFTQVHTKWAERGTLINSALQTMHDKLSATDVTYKKTEQAQVDQYTALANSI